MAKKLKKLKRLITEFEKELENLKTLPYYRLFKQETEQQKDIAAVTEKLEKLRAKYSVASRSLQLSA
jgi:predicted  nucleic acid-binding Zn-ribbon protein